MVPGDFRAHRGLAFPKTSVTLRFGPIWWAQAPRPCPALINDSDTAQGPHAGLGQLLLPSTGTQPLQAVQGWFLTGYLLPPGFARKIPHRIFIGSPGGLSQFGNSASNNSPKANVLWRNWGLVIGNKTPIFSAVFPGLGRSFQPSKYLLRLLFLLTQISNSLNYRFDFQIWQYQVRKSKS